MSKLTNSQLWKRAEKGLILEGSIFENENEDIIYFFNNNFASDTSGLKTANFKTGDMWSYKGRLKHFVELDIKILLTEGYSFNIAFVTHKNLYEVRAYTKVGKVLGTYEHHFLDVAWSHAVDGVINHKALETKKEGAKQHAN